MKLYGLFLLANMLVTHSFSYTISRLGTRMKLFMKRSKSAHISLYGPKTENQSEYVKYLNNEETKLVISTGPAGCGKTLFACQKAIALMKTENISKIVITRPVVSVDEEIGFLPGNLVKKMDPWTRPIFDLFLEHYSKGELDLMLMNGKVEICPLAFMRGRTFKHSFIIADEMQNSSPNQMKMLATRLGDNCRMVITGDLHQTDIAKENGLHEFVDKIEKFNETTEIIKLIKLDSGDIERSDVVRKVLEIYEYETPAQISQQILEVKNDTIVQEQNETIRNNTKYRIYNENDAALIPIQHSTKYHDVFMDRPEY
jgi:phosphate starvation-inducible PhoH-like protein